MRWSNWSRYGEPGLLQRIIGGALFVLAGSLMAGAFALIGILVWGIAKGLIP